MPGSRVQPGRLRPGYARPGRIPGPGRTTPRGGRPAARPAPPDQRATPTGNGALPFPTARSGADAYLEVGFTSGSLAPGQSTGDIQSRFHKTDWSVFDETDDYSYGTGTGHADSAKVTVYVDGALVWGDEPR